MSMADDEQLEALIREEERKANRRRAKTTNFSHLGHFPTDAKQKLAKPAPNVWVIMQNDNPIGVSFSRNAAEYQADSARFQWPFTVAGACSMWIHHPLGHAPTGHGYGPVFHVRGPFTAGGLRML